MTSEAPKARGLAAAGKPAEDRASGASDCLTPEGMAPEAGGTGVSAPDAPAPEALAALHARCFRAAPPPWSAADFAALLAEPVNFLVARPGGFALGRTAAGEAELLTIAVAPEARRGGLGRGLLAHFEAVARARGAAEAFLEVAEGNAAARALYAGAGYAVAGLRPRYYRDGRGGAEAALTLRKALGAAPSGAGKTD